MMLFVAVYAYENTHDEGDDCGGNERCCCWCCCRLLPLHLPLLLLLLLLWHWRWSWRDPVNKWHHDDDCLLVTTGWQRVRCRSILPLSRPGAYREQRSLFTFNCEFYMRSRPLRARIDLTAQKPLVLGMQMAS